MNTSAFELPIKYGSNCRSPGARFSKAPETFRARKAIFSSSVSENGEVYTPYSKMATILVVFCLPTN